MNQRVQGMLMGLALVVSGLLLGVTWNASWEAIPDGATALASDIDTFIKDFKTEVRQRVEVEHKFGNGSTDDNGLHELGSARCFAQNAAPTDIARAQYNSAAGADAGTTLSTEEIGPSTDDIGKGRCWIDLDGPDNVSGTPDDFSLAIWDETNNIWKYLLVGNPDVTALANERFLFDPGKYNLLYNGSFEVYDGVGGNNTSVVTPAGWTLSNATVTYTNNPTNTEGNGVQVNVTATAGNGAITQALTSLKASTTYYVVARVKKTAGLSCDMATSGAATNLNTTDVTSATFVSNSGTFVTDGVVTAVVLSLRSTNNTDVCAWDSVAVYELSNDRRGLSQAGRVVVYDSDTTNGTDVPVVKAAVPNLSASFTPPGPGWIVEVHAGLSFSNTAGSPNDNVQCNLDNGSDMAGTVRGTHIAAGGVTRVASLELSGVQINPTPGTMITYTAECESSSINMEYNGTPDVVQLSSNLWIVATPTR